MKIRNILMPGLICLLGCNSPRSGITGECTREFSDVSRSNWNGTGPRIIRTVIWYPGDSDGLAKPDSSYPALIIHSGCSIDKASSKYPLIILSHGSGGSARQMSWLGYELCSAGYIAVSIEHNGTAEEERSFSMPTLSDFCIWERPGDISAVLDGILQDKTFSKRIDKDRIGVAGFSLGGMSAIWVAGAKLDMKLLAANAAPPPAFMAETINRATGLMKTDSVLIRSGLRAEADYTDPRIKAAFALAPAIGNGFTKESLAKIHVPVSIVVGDKDMVAPAETSARILAESIPGAQLMVLPGERGHYIQPIPRDQQVKELKEVSEIVLAFFRNALHLE